MGIWKLRLDQHLASLEGLSDENSVTVSARLFADNIAGYLLNADHHIYCYGYDSWLLHDGAVLDAVKNFTGKGGTLYFIVHEDQVLNLEEYIVQNELGHASMIQKLSESIPIGVLATDNYVILFDLNKFSLYEPEKDIQPYRLLIRFKTSPLSNVTESRVLLSRLYNSGEGTQYFHRVTN
jgi:hypothetical protein